MTKSFRDLAKRLANLEAKISDPLQGMPMPLICEKPNASVLKRSVAAELEKRGNTTIVLPIGRSILDPDHQARLDQSKEYLDA